MAAPTTIARAALAPQAENDRHSSALTTVHEIKLQEPLRAEEVGARNDADLRAEIEDNSLVRLKNRDRYVERHGDEADAGVMAALIQNAVDAQLDGPAREMSGANSGFEDKGTPAGQAEIHRHAASRRLRRSSRLSSSRWSVAVSAGPG